MVKPRYETLEVSRGIAACLVVAVHTSAVIEVQLGRTPFRGIFNSGGVGVDFFFVLSGFIISFVHSKDIGHRDQFAPFLWKRFIRIFPAYWIVLFLLVLRHVAFPSFGQIHLLSATVLLKSTVLWPASIDENILSVAWTLSYELFFYGLFSLAILNKRLGFFLFFLWQTAVLITNLIGEPDAFSLQLINVGFLFGVVAAKMPVLRHGRWTTVIGAILFLTAALGMSPDGSATEVKARTMALAFGSAFIIYGLKCAEQKEIKLNRLPVIVGAASYSIYLVHYPVVAMAGRLLNRFRNAQPEMTFIGLAVTACVAGVAFHWAVEAPLVRSLRRMVLKKSA